MCRSQTLEPCSQVLTTHCCQGSPHLLPISFSPLSPLSFLSSLSSPIFLSFLSSLSSPFFLSFLSSPSLPFPHSALSPPPPSPPSLHSPPSPPPLFSPPSPPSLSSLLSFLSSLSAFPSLCPSPLTRKSLFPMNFDPWVCCV